MLGCTGALACAPHGKDAEVAGYRFVQLTDDDSADILPRVSPRGLVTWVGRSRRLGEGPRDEQDLEVLVWDGSRTHRITDDALEQTRPVVNDRGDLAWQVGGNGEHAEIVASIAGRRIRLTRDGAPVADRYPDINERGVVVWGRWDAPRESWALAVFDPRRGLPYRFFPGRFAYRPHVNAADHVEFERDHDVHDLELRRVVRIPTASELGYSTWRRGEINGKDQVALEADRGAEPSPDFEGARDILLWDGERMQTLHRSPVWAGRPDLNDAGVVVWEGFGGLPGSRSDPDDREIFVRVPGHAVVQLTDDAWDDQFPTVTGDGTVVWSGQGAYPGAASRLEDPEIFLARPLR
jgi:hypothetical protein